MKNALKFQKIFELFNYLVIVYWFSASFTKIYAIILIYLTDLWNILEYLTVKSNNLHSFSKISESIFKKMEIWHIRKINEDF